MSFQMPTWKNWVFLLTALLSLNWWIDLFWQTSPSSVPSPRSRWVLGGHFLVQVCCSFTSPLTFPVQASLHKSLKVLAGSRDITCGVSATQNILGMPSEWVKTGLHFFLHSFTFSHLHQVSCWWEMEQILCSWYQEKGKLLGDASHFWGVDWLLDFQDSQELGMELLFFS